MHILAKTRGDLYVKGDSGFLHDHKTGSKEQAAQVPRGPRNVLLQSVEERFPWTIQLRKMGGRFLL